MDNNFQLLEQVLTGIQDRLDKLENIQQPNPKPKEPEEHIGPYRVAPEKGTPYLSIQGSGVIIQFTWKGDDYTYDEDALANGNCYPLTMKNTLERAIKAKQYLFKACDKVRSRVNDTILFKGIHDYNGKFEIFGAYDRNVIYLFDNEAKAGRALGEIQKYNGAEAMVQAGWSL